MSAIKFVRDVFAHPSLEESHGLIFVEAMAIGCPVIAGRNSGATSWTLGDAGILVDVSKAEEIAEAMLTFYNSETKREQSIRNGFIQNSKMFEKNTIIKKYIAAYETVLKS